MTTSFSTITAPVAEIHTNLSQEIIQITDDKLRLVLEGHMRHAKDKDGWIGPFGVLLAVITVFCSSKFQDAFGITASAWQAIFFLLGVASSFWLIKTIIKIFRSPSIDTLMDKIKNRQTTRA